MQSIGEALFGKRYTGLKEIGAGGMGRVYKAYDVVKSKKIALKEMSYYHADSSAAVLRFKKEFRLMTAFQHPNTVQVFEFNLTENKTPFISMEFVTGKNLSELTDLSILQVVDILRQICQALGYIHSRLYIHRDLKPDNIKLLPDGTIKLLDYGLMTQLGTPSTGKISGTYYYLAPEVIVGGIVDQSTDLYALGVIGYELLTAQRPFRGNRKEILQGHLKHIPPEPITLRPNIPSSLNTVIMKLLEKDKDRRYQSSAAVLEDLQHLSGKKWQVETVAQKQGYLYSNKLIGRAKEVEQFRQLLQQLNQGQSASLFIGALAGVGKTRFLNEMRALTQLEETQTIYLDHQHTGEWIYGWIEGLRQRLIPMSDTLEIERYSQALDYLSQRRAGQLSDPDNLPSDEEITGVLIDWFAAVTQKTPLVLFLDDAHWMDLKSIQILNELIRAKSKLKILIVAGFRQDEVEKTSPLWYTPAEGESQYWVLSPLSKQQTKQLIETLLYPTLISEEFLNFSFNNCGGNVFDLMEFLRYLIMAGHLTQSGNQWLEPLNVEKLSLPKKLEERLLARINRLGAEIRTLAGTATILEDNLDLGNWQAVSNYKEESFFLGIDALIENQVVVKTNGSYQFAHDKIRTALYENLPEEQKRTYHHQIAELLEAQLTATDQTLIPLIAKHFVAAQDSNKAIEYSLQAAKTAEQNQAEWEAFTHYRAAAHFLETAQTYPDRDALLLEIYEKAAQFSSAAWGDAATCLKWLQKAIDYYTAKQDMEKVFSLSLSYVVTSAITSNYQAARRKIPEIIQTCDVQADSLLWAVLYGAGVCLVDWYQGYQNDCFDHAVAALEIFEKQLDTLPSDVWPAYSWAVFWRDKARAYLGQPIDMANIEKNRQLMLDGKSDSTIYWHTLTAVGGRAAFTGRWDDLLAWKELASRLSRQMGKIYWFECWISHSYLYGALHHGEFSQVEKHLERVQGSPDPYQVRLAYLFRGRYSLIQSDYHQAEQNLQKFLQLETESQDNSYLEGFIFLAQTYLTTAAIDQAHKYITEGTDLAAAGKYANPLYQLQFWQLKAQLALHEANYSQAEEYLKQSLNLAQTLDNPIQMGFTHKLWGLLHLEQQNHIAAAKSLNQARDIFLTLKNKYQAGQVITLLESFSRPTEDKGRPQPKEKIPADLMRTELGDSIAFTQPKTILNDEDLE